MKNKNIKSVFKKNNIFLLCLFLLFSSVVYSLVLKVMKTAHYRQISDLKWALEFINSGLKSSEESDKNTSDKMKKIDEKKRIVDSIIPNFKIQFEANANGSMDIIYTPLKDSSYKKEDPTDKFLSSIKINSLLNENESYTTEIIRDVDVINYEMIVKKIDEINTHLAKYFEPKTKQIHYGGIKGFESWFGFYPVISMLNICLIIWICYFIYNSIEKTSAQLYGKNLVNDTTQVKPHQKTFTFQDIAGADDEKEEMSELIDFLKYSKKYESMGARIPKGILLFGPPGVGKTLLARAVAGEAKVPFYYASGSEFIEMYVGLGASRIRKLFQEAKRNAPCIVFIDEIETIAHKRGGNINPSHSEQDQTLNQLLVEMDGFLKNVGVIVMAATNQPDSLDTALLRPGRFDRHLYVNLPSIKDREAILELHAKNKKFSDDFNLKTLAQQTPGFSGAELEAVLNESALLATRRKADCISNADISEALDRVLLGPSKKSKTYSAQEKKTVAYHEAGHAVIGLKLSDANQVQKVTIIPRGKTGGYNLMMPETETFFSSKKRFLAQITSYLGGRIAEELVFDDISTGAFGDFSYATEIARKMVTHYGMSNLGPIQYIENVAHPFYKNYSDSKAIEIDKEVQEIINHCYQKAKKILVDNRNLLDLIAKYLLEIETITKKDLEEIVDKGYIGWWEKSKQSNIDKDTDKNLKVD